MISGDEIVYLDNNATTQIDPAVIEEMTPFLTRFYGNPSSGYRFGGQVRKAINLARERVAALLGCGPDEIVFTSGGTESNNAALNSALDLDPRGKHIVTSAVEHSAITRHCAELEKRGAKITRLNVDAQGNLDLSELENAIRQTTAIVSLMWANNETGVLFPIEKIAGITAHQRVSFHTDAVQAAGKLPIKLADRPINFLSLFAHKLHGPKGVGALYVSRCSRFVSSQIGGGQENGRRAGTENVAAIVGFGKAAELAASVQNLEAERVGALRDRFEKDLRAKIDNVWINGNVDARLPNTASISFGDVDASALLALLDRENICCSGGSACRTEAAQGSHVLRAMRLSEDRIRGGVRFSFGRFNTEAQVDRVLEVLQRALAKLRRAPIANSLVEKAIA